MIGQTISHYKILEKLGEGGMGVVYKAEDIKLKRIVALKFLPHHLTKTEEEQARFLQEAQAAATLNHPNVCSIHTIEEHDDQQLIDMEYVDGTTLRQQLGTGNLKLETALSYSVQIAEALHEAHSKGIVHRDVKPDNIMVNSKNQIKVMDFGLAKLKGTLKLTKTSSTVGTLAYMAPEQIQGGEVDARSDIFSFGVVLFEMISGRSPFRGEHEAAMMYSILNEEPDPLTKYLPDALPELTHILGRALEKDPEDRYQSVHEMLIDLRRLKKDTTRVVRTAAHEVPVETEPLPPTPVQEPPTQPSPTARTTSVTINIPTVRVRTFLLPALAVIVIAMAAVVYFFFFQKERDDVQRIPIVVADFVNETKEAELDGLSGMLITALEQSRRLDVLPRVRMFDILRMLGKGNVDRVDESVGKEICREARIHSLVLASIRKFGKVYTIDMKVVDPNQGKYLFTATETGEGQESIPALLDKLSEKTRIGFKETPSQIQSSAQKVSEVTTSNLQAYQHFFQGEQLINKVKYVEAQEEYHKAVSLDSAFGLAWYRLAYAINWQSGSQVRAKEPLEHATVLIDRIPEKERYLVRALETQNNRGFLEGIAILKEMEKIYPNEKEMLYNIGDWSFHAGKFPSAEEYLTKVLAMDPTMDRALEHLSWTYRDMRQYDKMLVIAKRYVASAGSAEAYGLMAQAYAGLEKFDEGLRTLQQAKDLFPTNYQLSGLTADMYTYIGEYGKAESEIRSRLRDDQPMPVRRWSHERLATFYSFLGKYRNSMQHFESSIDLYWQAPDTVGAVRTMVLKGMMLVLQRNDIDNAMKLAEKTYAYQAGIEDVNYWAGLAELLVYRRNISAAESIFTNRFSSISWVDPFYRTIIYGTNHECARAETYLDTVLSAAFDQLKIWALYVCAKCRLDEDHYDRALELISQLQKINNNGGGFRAVFYPKSLYLAARVYEKKGNRKLAIENYQKLLTLWKDADKDIPELIDAKSRLSKLKGVALK